MDSSCEFRVNISSLVSQKVVLAGLVRCPADVTCQQIVMYFPVFGETGLLNEGQTQGLPLRINIQYCRGDPCGRP